MNKSTGLLNAFRCAAETGPQGGLMAALGVMTMVAMGNTAYGLTRSQSRHGLQRHAGRRAIVQGTEAHVEPVPQEGHPWEGSEPTFAISPDGHYVVSSSATRLKLWNAQGELLRDLEKPTDDACRRPVFSQDGQRLLLIGQGHTAIYALPSGQKLRELKAVEFSDDARFLIRRKDDEISFADARTGRKLGKIQAHPSGPNPEFLDFSPNGSLVAAGQTNHADADGKMRLWNVHSGRLARVLADPRGGFGAGNGVIGPAAWSPDGKTLVTGGEDPNWYAPVDDGPNDQAKYFHAYALKVWDVATGRLLKVWPGYGSNEEGVPVNRFVSAHAVLVGRQVVDINSGKVIRELPSVSALSRDTRLQISYTDNEIGTFELRETWTGKVRARYPGRGLAAFDAMSWSPDGALLAAAESRATPVRVFDAQSGALKLALSTQGEGMLTLRWLPDGILNVNTLQSSWLWNRNGQLKRHWRPPAHSASTASGGISSSITENPQDSMEYSESVGVSPDGALFISQGNSWKNEPRDVLHVWASNGQLIRDIPHFLRKDTSSEAYRLLWVDNARVVRPTEIAVEIWNAREGVREATLTMPATLKYMVPAAVSPDGHWLICNGEEKGPGSVTNNQLLLWDLSSKALQRIYRHVDPVAYWSGDSQHFVALTYQTRRVTLFTPAADEPQATLPIAFKEWNWNEAVALSPDLKLLATADKGYNSTTSSIWNVEKGKLMLTLHLFMSPRKTVKGYRDMDAPVAWLALTPDGFYDGSPGIERWLRWRRGQTLLPMGALQAERKKPARIRAALIP